MTTTITVKVSRTSDYLKQVFKFIRPYGRKKLVKVTLVAVLQALGQVISVAAVFPFLALAADPVNYLNTRVGTWIQWLLPNKEPDQLLLASGLFLIFAIFGANAVSMFGEYYRARFTTGFGHWLTMHLLRQINSKPYSWFLNQNSSALVKKTTQDVMIFVNQVLSQILDMVSRSLISLLLLVTISIVEPIVTLIMVSVVGATYTLIFLLLKKLRIQISNELKIRYLGIFHTITELYSGIKSIKVYGASSLFVNKIENHSSERAKLLAQMPLISNSPRYLIEPLVASLIITVVLVSVLFDEDTTKLIPGLGLLAVAGFRLLPAIQMLYSQLTTIHTARHAFEELQEVFSELENACGGTIKNEYDEYINRVSTSPIEFKANIKLKDVSFNYPGSNVQILDDVSITIPKNSSVAFVGETGSGKSTLVDIFLGLQLPTKGHVLIDGKYLDSDPLIRAWQVQIGYVPQEIYLIDDTIARNIAFGVPDSYQDQERVREVAAMCQLQNFIERTLPNMYDTIVGERGIRMSGGQRQRIGLARALYHRPEVLILDEATSALDSETESRIIDVVYKLANELTVMIVTHRISTLGHIDKIYEIKNQKLKPIVLS